MHCGIHTNMPYWIFNFWLKNPVTKALNELSCVTMCGVCMHQMWYNIILIFRSVDFNIP